MIHYEGLTAVKPLIYLNDQMKFSIHLFRDQLSIVQFQITLLRTHCSMIIRYSLATKDSCVHPKADILSKQYDTHCLPAHLTSMHFQKLSAAFLGKCELVKNNLRSSKAFVGMFNRSSHRFLYPDKKLELDMLLFGPTNISPNEAMNHC